MVIKPGLDHGPLVSDEWRRERAAREAREKADEKQCRQAQRARRAVLPALVDQPRGSTDVINELAAALIARGP